MCNFATLVLYERHGHVAIGYRTLNSGSTKWAATTPEIQYIRLAPVCSHMPT